jgi:hypothetical protein
MTQALCQERCVWGCTLSPPLGSRCRALAPLQGAGLLRPAACLSAAPEAPLLTRLFAYQVEEVFAYVGATPEREFSLSLAYLEIYNENVRDLLNPAAKLDVYEGLQGVEVKNCKPTPVDDVAAVRWGWEKEDRGHRL